VSQPLRKDSIRTRESLLATAEKLLGADSTASFAELAIAAGVSTATVYRHFQDRPTLLIALMERALEEIEAEVDGWVLGPTSFDDLLRLMSEHQARYQGVLSAVRRGEVVGPKMGELEVRTRDLFIEAHAEAAKAGTLRSDLTLDDVIPLLAMIDGALSAVEDPRAREATAARAVEVILDGIHH
jgi:AcrR family transcriptional regulator